MSYDRNKAVQTVNDVLKYLPYGEVGERTAEDIVRALEDAFDEELFNANWTSVKAWLPEELPENKGKKVIPCLVAVKSRYSKGKPNIEKRQRQWLKDCNGEFVEWEWSRLRCEQITHWMPLPEPPKGD